ncbi:MAG: HAD family hydrolase [Pseudomonadota bacterium]
MITTVLFDKDGTLFDFQKSWANWSARFLLELCRGDVAKAAEMSDAVGYDLDARAFCDDSVLVSGTPGDIAEHLLPFVPGMSPSGLIARMNVMAADAPQVEATPLQPLMLALKARGLRLGVITNDNILPTKSHLRAVGIAHHMDRIIGSDSGFGEKPNCGQIMAFWDLCGGSPAETVMVGDSVHDLMAARAAGCVGVGVMTGVSPRSMLAPLADAVLNDVSELPDFLDAMESPGVSAA